MFLFIMSTILLTGFNLAIRKSESHSKKTTTKKIVAGRKEERSKGKESQIWE